MPKTLPSLKIQPWKALRTMEEDPNPAINRAGPEDPPSPSSGASVHDPMRLRTGYGNTKNASPQDNNTATNPE
ncbi:hypothetical protein LY78DRAFT_662081 [Colletotrichum sublineola]|uniref:Uncharacterized protein n=1 Tax=Colletotrichum sublineola TaxID=1173701 RepID=A0A066XSG7_COLSU|nr:hypothetical protein LY78DRAFT_662081 [Colletotrichum sublineola]KDN68940.1 hypothetical protein CSUB01_09358 [Colletotrichum sublineola]